MTVNSEQNKFTELKHHLGYLTKNISESIKTETKHICTRDSGKHPWKNPCGKTSSEFDFIK
jgi:hypothetical protein